MSQWILFDDESRDRFLPFTYTRPISELRVGILTVKEKWEKVTQHPFSYLTGSYLSDKFPTESGNENILINGRYCPDKGLIDAIGSLKENEVLTHEGVPVACKVGKEKVEEWMNIGYANLSQAILGQCSRKKDKTGDHLFFNRPWELFQSNGIAIEEDFHLLTEERSSQQISGTNGIIGDRVFIEEGAKVEHAMLNSEKGPIYIGKDAEIMEGSVVRGPFALLDNAVVKMSAKIYGPTTIGPYSKVGGEVNNSIFIGFSNKAHDGFLGNSVIGEWCNLGADTNNSNLKNNYGEVKVWDYTTEGFENSGVTFCGLMMGDHSKCGINTMFNTGTVVGVSANIFGGDFPSKFIPSFTWGGVNGSDTFALDKAIEVAKTVCKRRNIHVGPEDERILERIFKDTGSYRKK